MTTKVALVTELKNQIEHLAVPREGLHEPRDGERINAVACGGETVDVDLYNGLVISKSRYSEELNGERQLGNEYPIR